MSTLLRLILEFVKDLFVEVEEVRLRTLVLVDRWLTRMVVASAVGMTIAYQAGRHLDALSRLGGRIGR